MKLILFFAISTLLFSSLPSLAQVASCEKAEDSCFYAELDMLQAGQACKEDVPGHFQIHCSEFHPSDGGAVDTTASCPAGIRNISPLEASQIELLERKYFFEKYQRSPECQGQVAPSAEAEPVGATT